MELMTWLKAQWDRVAAWVAIAGGALALLLGWLGVSRAAFPAEQIPYVISGGMFGLFLVGVGGLLWLSADLRDEWRKLDDLDRRLGVLTERAEQQAFPEVESEPSTNGKTAPPRRAKAASAP